MSSSEIKVPDDANCLITTLDLYDILGECGNLVAPIFDHHKTIEVLRHPVTRNIIFRSDQRYFLDEDHGNIMVDPFNNMPTHGVNILNAEGKVVMSVRDYWMTLGLLDYSREASDSVINVIAMCVQNGLNSHQHYAKDLDVSYLSDAGDTLALARLAGRETDYVNAMNAAGHVVEIPATNPSLASLLFSKQNQAFQIPRFDITADELVTRIRDSETPVKPTTNMDYDAQYKRMRDARLVITDEDERRAELDKLAEEFTVDTTGLRGITTKTKTRSEYVHHVSSMTSSAEKIFSDYVECRELTYELEEIHGNIQRFMRKTFPTLQEIIKRSDEPAYGWDVYKVKVTGKTFLEVHHAYDLRIHEWHEQKNHLKYLKGN